MMGHKQRLKGGSEWDCFGKKNWRDLLGVFKRSGVSHEIKKKYSRRVRKEMKAVAKKYDW